MITITMWNRNKNNHDLNECLAIDIERERERRKNKYIHRYIVMHFIHDFFVCMYNEHTDIIVIHHQSILLIIDRYIVTILHFIEHTIYL